MADYETIHVHPDVHERFVALVNEHTPTDKKTEGMRYVLDAAERGFAADEDDAPVDIDVGGLAREVSARIDTDEIGRKTADKIRSDLR